MTPTPKPQNTFDAFDDAPTAKREVVGTALESLLEEELEEEDAEALRAVKLAV
jgi:hypothetical protein